MFKNKSIVMHVVDNKDLAAEAGTPSEPIDYGNIIQDLTMGVCVIIGFYMFSDTLRQIVLK